MTCQNCIHRLDVTLWGLWLATGCRLGLVIRARCEVLREIAGNQIFPIINSEVKP